MEFTEEDIKAWRAFEKVRKGGRYNMFDPRAQKATRLEREKYLFVMKNFTELEEEATKRKEK